jgi:hypothetical protein
MKDSSANQISGPKSHEASAADEAQQKKKMKKAPPN